MKRIVMKTLLNAVLTFAFTSLVWTQPTISSFTPGSGSVGTAVTINGSGFNGVVPGNNIVYFGAVRAVVTGATTSSITVSVPPGATYAPITVTTGGLTAYSRNSFIVTFGALPLIDATILAGKVDYSVSPSSGPHAVALGDIDRDGKPDLVIANSGSGDIRIMRNTSVSGGLTPGSFDSPGLSYPAGTAPSYLALGDLDGDGDLDIVVSDTVGGRIYVWQNGSTIGTIDSTSMSAFGVGTKPFGLDINDLDINGQPDIFVALKGADSIAVLKNTSIATLSFAQSNYSTGVGSNPYEVRVQSDIDADGQLDVVTVNRGNSRSSVFLNGGSFPGTIFLNTPTSVILGSGASSFVLYDLDGDNKVDIISSNQTGNSVSLLRNTTVSTGSALFASKVDIGAGTNPFKIALADFDGDGKPDVVVSNRSADSVSVLRNTAIGGAFTSSTLAPTVQFRAGTSPSGLALGDVDGDGKPDIVSANQGAGNVSIFRNKAIRQVAEVGNDSTLATPMNVGETIQSVLTAGSDVDYYKFVLNPDDTVSIEAFAANNGNLLVLFEIYDTSGNYYKYRYERVDETHSWYVFAPNIGAPRAFLLRISSQYNSTSFPNSTPKRLEPQIVPGSAAAQDSGYYQLSIERFVPSAPRIYYYSDVYSESYNRARWWIEFYPNGLSTTATIEYSTAPNLSGSTIIEAAQSPDSGISRLYFDSFLSGLSPNTHYYFRTIATNSMGTAQTPIYEFDTPPAPVGWVHQFVGLSSTIMGMSYGDDTTGIAVGYGNLWKRTTNAGDTWTTFSNPAGYNLYGVWMVNSLLGFAVGGNESIVKTTDGGASWVSLPNTGTGYDLWRVKFVNPLAGVAVGSGGLIVKTANNGTNWTVARPIGGYELRGVDYADLNTVVAVGYNGTILRSTNGGTSWDSIPRQPSWPYYLYGVDFVSSTTGYAVGNNAVLKSTDAGVTWNILNIPNINLPWLYDISFKDASKGIIVGDGGAILRTTDGGVSWERQPVGTYSNFYASAYRGRSLSAGGENGLVLSSLDPKVEDDPIDTSLASAIPIIYRDEVDARIDPADVDYYKFTAADTDTIAVFVEGRDTAVVNGFLQLFDVDGTTLLESNDDFVPGDSVRSRVVRILPAPGTYYIRYAGTSSDVTGNYRIALNKAQLKPVVPFGGVATIVTTSEVILKSPVIPNNIATTIEFEYGLTAAYGMTATADQSGQGGQQLITATSSLTGLTPFAEYHFRVKATNAGGITYGPDVTFLTALGMLRTETEPNNISSAATTIFIGDTVHATLATNTDVDYFRFQAAAGDTLEIFLNERNASGLYSKFEVIDSTGGFNRVFGYPNDFIPDPLHLHAAFVAVNTGVYHIRQSYQSNWNSYYPNQAAKTPEPTMGGKPQVVPTSAAADNGDYELRFRRFVPSAPDVRKNPWADVTFATTATIHADVTSNGSPTDVYVEYGTSQSLGSSTQYLGGPVTTLGYQYWFRIPLSGLNPGTLYYFRLKAVNAIGTSYSDITTFSTAPVSEKWVQKFPNTDQYMRGVSAANDSLAVVLGEGRMHRTTNAGTTWNETSLPRYPYSVAFKDQDTAFAAGYSIIKSVDRGATWQFDQDFPVNTYANKIRFYDSQIGAVAGGKYNESIGQWGGAIGRTLDGGATWEIVRTFARYMSDVFFVTADTVRAISDNGWFYRTNDFTATIPAWDSVQIALNEGTEGLAFVDGVTGIVVGSRIMRTTNGGTTWTQVANPNYYMYEVAMKNAQVGFAVGGGGQIYRTINAGASWTQEPSGATTWLTGASYVGRTAIAVGEVGTILYSLDPLNEQEPNNSSGTANPFAIGEQLEGSIGSSGDIDFYSFAAAGNDTLEVLLTPGSTGPAVNGALELIGPDGSTVLAQNDDFIAGDTSTARVVRIIPGAGTNYLRVSGSTSGSVGTYLLRLRRTNLKPGIVSVNLTVTPTSASITGLVVPNNLNTTVQVQWDATTAYGQTPVPINEGTLSGQQRRTVTATLTGLTENSDYFLRLVAVNSAGTTTGVDIPFHTPRASALAEAEPNDSAHMAQEIAIGDSVNGSILPLNDVDYYKLHVLPGDTVEFFSLRRGTSELFARIQIIDSASQGTYENLDWFPRNDSLHSIMDFNNPMTLYIRYNYSYNYNSSFPGSRNEDGILPLPQIAPTGSLETASQDTGEYRLWVRRFVRSAPEGQDYVGYSSIFSDAVRLQTTIQANGLPTTANFEYGTTQAYGSQVTAENGPFVGHWRQGINSPLVTGLQPNTTYYVRTALTNSAGSSYGGGNAFTTPPASEGWTRHTAATNLFLRDAEFLSESTGFISGNGGFLVSTTDGGATWNSVTSGTVATLQSISFTSSTVGMISGNGGVVLKTTDGGANWAQQTSGVTSILYSLKMLNVNEAIAVGVSGVVIRTTNSGAGWTTVRTGTEFLRSVTFSPAGDTGYAAGYTSAGDPVLLKTTDRGANWQTVTISTGGNYLLSGWFHDGRRGVVAGTNRTFYRTDDGGATWTQTSPSSNGYYVYGMSFADTSNGVAVGDYGSVYRTYDGGRNWVAQGSGTYNVLYGVTMKGRSATAVGQSGSILRAFGLLEKPANLAASYSSPEYVNLMWDDINGETGYFVERKTGSGGTYSRFRTLSADSVGTVDTVSPGRIYYYRVQGFTAIDTSLYSTEDSALVPLRVPANLVATALSKTSVQLTWQNGTDTRDGYYIERQTVATWSAIDTVGNVTTYTDVSASSGTSYAYRIRSYNSDMVSAYSNTDNETTPGLVIAPSNLVATYQSPNFVNIAWSDNADNEVGYWIESKIGAAGTYALLRAVGQGSTSTVDTILSGRIYYYRVRGYSAADTSSYAAEDSALAPLFTPSNLNASTLSSTSVGLSWQNSADARTGYRIERKTGSGGTFAEIATTGNVTAYTDNSAGSATRYHYRIRSFTSEMNSAYSNADSALTALGKPQSITANPASVTNAPITISWSSPNGAVTAWYNIDSRATLNPPSTQVAVTNNSFVLTNPPAGDRWIYVVLQDAEGNTDLAAYDSVRTRFDNVAPQIVDQTTLVDVIVSGSTISSPASLTIQASVAKPSGIAALQIPVLQYKKTNSTTINQAVFPSASGGSTVLSNLGSVFLTIGKPNGAEYRIVATDAAGNTAATTWRSFTVFVNTPPVSDFVPPAAGTTNDITALVSNYRLFSVPYELQDKKPATFMETIDKGLGPHAKDGVNYYNWRMQRYINATYQDYEDFKTQDVLTPGTAFFLVSRQQKSVTVGSGNLVKAQDMFNSGIQVFQGWNLVGNPFPDDFAADSLFLLAGSIVNRAYYDGTGPDAGWWKTGANVQWLKKWEGLAINVSQNTSLRFRAVPQTSEKAIPPPAGQSAHEAIAEKQEGGWLMKLDAHRTGSPIIDIGNMIGEAPGAEEGYDQFDSFQPPLLPGRSLAVYFKNPDGGMSSDIRPIQSNGSAWEMKVVTGDRGSRVKLDISEVMAIPDPAIEAYLLDIDDHMAHDLREKRSVEFASKEGIRNFRIVVGSKGFVDSVSVSLGIDLVPQIFMLYQNYPNPFNPETAVRFWLPGAAPSYKVSLRVYNIIGQEVATLIDRDMKAGYYETTFSGRNFASGTYVYRLTVDGGTKETTFSAVKKMVMVK